MTNLSSLKPGDPVNLETDIVAKYLEKWTRREETVQRLDGGADWWRRGFGNPQLVITSAFIWREGSALV